MTTNPQEQKFEWLDELREKLAAIEHERWADWQRWMHTKGTWIRPIDKDYLAFPKEYIDHLEKQIATPYADLSEAEQASDMEQVDRYWPLIIARFTELGQQHQAELLRARIGELQNLGIDAGEYAGDETYVVTLTMIIEQTRKLQAELAKIIGGEDE